MSSDGFLAASGFVTRNRWQSEPERVPVVEHYAYDRLAAELTGALGRPVRVVEEPGPPDAFLQLVQAVVADDALDPARTLLLDADPTDLAHVASESLLGALTTEGLDRWRAGEPAGERALYGRADAPGMTAGAERFGYAYLSRPDAPDLPALVAAYVQAAGL
jgi:hypothetical protein